MPGAVDKQAPAVATEETLLVFGPCIPKLLPASLADLRTSIKQNPKLGFLVPIVKSLPQFWEETIETNCPWLAQLPGAKEHLSQLLLLLDADPASPLKPPEGLRNLLLVPLTVISQIVEHTQLGHQGPALGFCVGFLATAAVACSRGGAELERWTVTALRLAICIGAVVDLDEHLETEGYPNSPQRSSAWSVRWMLPSQKAFLEETLQSLPQAYVSCVTDEDRVTVTATEGTRGQLTRRLTDAGLSIQPVGLWGRYHYSSPDRLQAVEEVKLLCRRDENMRFPSPEQLRLPLRSTSDGQVIETGLLHEIAIDDILTNTCFWYDTINTTVRGWRGQAVRLISVGSSTGTIPKSLKDATATRESVAVNSDTQHRNQAPKAASAVVDSNGLSDFLTNGTEPMPRPTPNIPPGLGKGEPEASSRAREAVAVVGMACRYAQADSLDEFWSLIDSGRNAVGPVPVSRFGTDDVWRNPKGPFWGAFTTEADKFDHRFFHMSAREAASMDPQQRLLLQVAYEAMESAGYAGGVDAADEIVGCYIGAGYVEYEDNVASADASAFSATGTIRAFISGRVSHHFGWTGPSVVFDTACSSSAVAIHHACQAIQTGDCTVAVAGGVNVITSPTFYQNLAAASFLSPTGASKAFDAEADGYCRGEGAGALVLKPLRAALAANDPILGIIAGSAVNQNSSVSPITVPDSQSQSDLYLHALRGAGITPSEVTYVEAHGTGTPVGDPIEFASIRSALGGSHRDSELVVGSVKDVIGHTESASGVAGVIKTLLMLQHAKIPKQPNFKRLSPRIPSPEGDRIAIASAPRPWGTAGALRTALVNNYGAAGSNAAIILQELAHLPVDHGSAQLEAPSGRAPDEYPILLSGKTPESLRAYSSALVTFLDRNPSVAPGDIAYNLARKQNPRHEYAVSWTASSLVDIQRGLGDVASGNRAVTRRSLDKPPGKTTGASSPPSVPVVLCFGGQTGRCLHLSRDLAQGAPSLRDHLDRCDKACRALGLPSIFPRIFDSSPVDDIVELHTLLFSVQYASAQAWLESGVRVAALVGHSFGQLTALCVAGSLALADGLRLVTGRAQLIRQFWGADTGAMLAVEGDAAPLDRLLAELTRADQVDVACRNGARNIVLAGESEAIGNAEQACRAAPGLRAVRLANSHAYHSRLADPIVDGLRALAESVAWRSPSLHVETCSAGQSWDEVTADKIVQHTRGTVHFGDAVQRLAARYPSCVWLEAGSASPITGMANRALASLPAGTRGHEFIPVDLGASGMGGRPWASVARTSCRLWEAGAPASFWAFHGVPPRRFRWLHLPPYQFAKTQHWMPWRPMRPPAALETLASPSPTGSPELVRLLKADANEHTFAIDASHPDYDVSLRGHAVLGQALCPAGLYFEMAIRAARILQADSVPERTTVPHMEALHIQSPLGLHPDGSLFLALKAKGSPPGGTVSKWEFSIFSARAPKKVSDVPHIQRTVHASGIVSMAEAVGVASRLRFLGRLMGKERLADVAGRQHANRLSGDVLYRVFGRVVNYAPCYKGVRNATACDGEVVGDVVMPGPAVSHRPGDMLSNPLAIDNFLQVAGIHVNCLQPGGNDDMVHVCNAIEELHWSEDFLSQSSSSSSGGGSEPSLNTTGAAGEWKVYSNMENKGDGTILNDVLVLDPKTGAVVLALLGARFAEVPVVSLRRLLSRLSRSDKDTEKESDKERTVSRMNDVSNVRPSATEDTSAREGCQRSDVAASEPRLPSRIVTSPSNDAAGTAQVELRVREMLSEIFGMGVEEIQPSSSLVDMGLDSLMVTEMSGEILKRFTTKLTMEELTDLTDVQSLMQALGGTPSKDVAIATPTSTATTSSVSTTASQSGLSQGSAASESLDDGTESSRDDSLGQHGKPTDSDGGLAAVGSHWLATNRLSFDDAVAKNGFSGFRQLVYPAQCQLTAAYTVEALSSLGCDLGQLSAGETLPKPAYLPTYDKLMAQMYKILQDAGLVTAEGLNATRTALSVPKHSSVELHERLVREHPQYAYELELLRTTGSRLGDCLAGRAEPLALMFGDARARRLMENVYGEGPMFRAAAEFLAEFLVAACERFGGAREIAVLELGAGTGGTTGLLAERLGRSAAGRRVRYTFSDLSASLIAAARKKFSRYPFIDYAVVDVTKDPAPQHRGRYDIIVSTNCIHATPDLVRSCSHIRQMLAKDGMLCLVENTQNLSWFDLVWGLVDGWWLFNDGRTHALASETQWQKALHDAGFPWVDWSDGRTEEAKILRVIAASSTAQAAHSAPSVQPTLNPVGGLDTMETVVFKYADAQPLQADVYYPAPGTNRDAAHPVALMIHGGGHVMLSRKDVRPKQTQLLLAAGFVAVSLDYRLCPETTLAEGPMADVRDGLAWARNTLPGLLRRRRPDVRIDGGRVVAVGWSTGGHLALSLGWTAAAAGVAPPDAVLAFYCPSDYDDACWSRPNLPFGAPAAPLEDYDLDDGLADHPLVAYNPPPAARAAGGWMSSADARSRIVLHMNWRGMTVPVLVHGLKKRRSAARFEEKEDEDEDEETEDKVTHGGRNDAPPRLPAPTAAQVRTISPLAQIRDGAYRTPTFLVHPEDDDLIPWQQAQRTAEALARHGVEAELRIVRGAGHLFDLYARYDGHGEAAAAMADGYRFLAGHAGLG